jgi:uncharacterized Zn finger protein
LSLIICRDKFEPAYSQQRPAYSQQQVVTKTEKDAAMYYDWKPYVPVAKRLANAKTFAAKQAKKEDREPTPVKCTSRKLATSFWGQAWCKNLDSSSDFANRLARGRTYLGNGSVVDLRIQAGEIHAIVAGSEVYEVTIKINTLKAKNWNSLKKDCASSIHSLLDLLQGRFDEGVMQRMVQAGTGLLPRPAEIEMDCSCPDYARVCKHVAAVIYGVGVRLDAAPELLFVLRNVDHSELITQAVAAENLEQTLGEAANPLAGSDLSEMFGIDLVTSSAVALAPQAKKPRKVATRATATTAKKRTPTASRTK